MGEPPTDGRAGDRSPLARLLERLGGLDRVLLVLGGVLCAYLLQQAVYRSGFGSTVRTDFTVYRAAGEAVLAGTDPYAAVNERGWAFNGLPALAVAMVPFALVPIPIGAALFALLSLWSVWVALRAWCRLAAPAGDRSLRIRIGALAVLAVAAPLISGTMRGQPSIPAGALGAWALAHAFAGGRRAVGAALAGATAIKIFPAFWIAGLFAARRPGAAVSAGLWLVLFSAAAFAVRGPEGGVADLKACVAASTPHATAAAGDPVRYGQTLDPRIARNQSFEAVSVRLHVPDAEVGLGGDLERRARLLGRVVAVLLFLAGVAAARRAAGAGRAALAGAALCAPAVWASPVAWSHYFVAVLPAAAVVAAAALGAPSGPLSRGVARKALVASLALTLVGLADEGFKRAGNGLASAGVLWAVCAAAAARKGSAEG